MTGSGSRSIWGRRSWQNWNISGHSGLLVPYRDKDALFLRFAGVNAIGGLKEVLKGLSLTEAVIALDMDKMYKKLELLKKFQFFIIMQRRNFRRSS